jgi:hypothetical protein
MQSFVKHSKKTTPAQYTHFPIHIHVYIRRYIKSLGCEKEVGALMTTRRKREKKKKKVGAHIQKVHNASAALSASQSTAVHTRKYRRARARKCVRIERASACTCCTFPVASLLGRELTRLCVYVCQCINSISRELVLPRLLIGATAI